METVLRKLLVDDDGGSSDRVLVAGALETPLAESTTTCANGCAMGFPFFLRRFVFCAGLLLIEEPPEADEGWGVGSSCFFSAEVLSGTRMLRMRKG